MHRMHPDPAHLDDPDAILFDDCDRCDEHAELLTSLDDDNLRTLHYLALQWHLTGKLRPRTLNERLACQKLWRFAIVLERLGGPTTGEQLVTVKL
jgi:hypothetical protein